MGVLTVIKEEFEEISEILGVKQNLSNTSYYVREFNTHKCYDIVLKKLSGRGNIVSATGTREFLEDFRPDYILLVGIAGGIKGADLPQLADVVVADFVDGYEMRKLSNGQSRKRMEAYDHPGYRLKNFIAEPAANSSTWQRRIKKRRPSGSKYKEGVTFGNLIYGEKILGDDEDAYQKKVFSEFDNVAAVDMESGGVARAVYEARSTKHYNPQYLIIRGISDFVNGSSNAATRQKWKRYAAHVAGAFAAEVADDLIRLG